MLQQVQCELRRSEASGNVWPNVQPGLRQLDRHAQPTTCSNNTITPPLVDGVPVGNPLFWQSKGTYSGVLDRAENPRSSTPLYVPLLCQKSGLPTGTPSTRGGVIVLLLHVVGWAWRSSCLKPGCTFGHTFPLASLRLSSHCTCWSIPVWLLHQAPTSVPVERGTSVSRSRYLMNG